MKLSCVLASTAIIFSVIPVGEPLQEYEAGGADSGQDQEPHSPEGHGGLRDLD